MMSRAHLWTKYPIIGISGWSGAGKTTLIEALIPRLDASGLRVAVVKHDAHGIDVDRRGKDSDRFFRAGASVVLTSPDQQLRRLGRDVLWESLEATVQQLLAAHDVVLLEGHKASPFPKLWLQGTSGDVPPEGAVAVFDVLPRSGDRVGRAFEHIMGRVRAASQRPPRFGGVLVGGKSRRMGSPKHALMHRGKTWLDLAVESLSPHVDQVVLLGSQSLSGSLLQLPDAPETTGPMAGFLSAFRWAPRNDWLIAACDLPNIHAEAVAWLVDQHRPGRWAVVPEVSAGLPEPLFASYSFRCGPLFEELSRQGHLAPRHIVDRPTTARPLVPKELAPAWLNVNDPAGRTRLVEESA